MAKTQLDVRYERVISLENLLEAWPEFVRGKRNRKDVQEFELRLTENIFALQRDLRGKTYTHSAYEAFSISDPKPRSIHKASVRDRLLHRAIYRLLYPFFDKTFATSSYSCRKEKGSHKALEHFRRLAFRVSNNHTRTVWVLKCDVRKFFASIDQECLLAILAERIPDRDVLWLLGQVVQSFYSTRDGVGLPLGNLTSQLLVNIYMNEFDQFVKHTLKMKAYVRYADDFVLLSADRSKLEQMLLRIHDFLLNELRLTLHPNKVSIKTFASGIDFLGWVHFTDHRVLRASSKRRMFRRIEEVGGKEESVQSYLGLLSHGNTWKMSNEVKNDVSHAIVLKV
jgi:retron-type reverse transcriptase